MRLALASLCVALATQASATVPLPDCSFNTQTGRLEPAIFDGRPLRDVYVGYAGEGFISWGLYDPDDLRPLILVLQNCRSGEDLVATLPDAGYAGAEARWSALVYSDTAFTVRQLQDEMVRMGARVKRVNNQFGNCACDVSAEWE